MTRHHSGPHRVLTAGQATPRLAPPAATTVASVATPPPAATETPSATSTPVAAVATSAATNAAATETATQASTQTAVNHPVAIRAEDTPTSPTAAAAALNPDG